LDELINAKAARFSPRWGHGEDDAVTAEALASLYEVARKEGIPGDFTAEDLEGGLARFSAHTGRGADNLGPVDARRLPAEGKTGLADLFSTVRRDLVWPWQLLITVEALIPKTSGDDRAIGLLPWLCRLFAQVTGAPIRLRVAQAPGTGEWDDAVAGSSALIAGLRRASMGECCRVLGFYDWSSIVHLVRAIIFYGFPARLAYLSFLMYISVRFMSQEGAVSDPIYPTRSFCRRLSEGGSVCQLHAH